MMRIINLTRYDLQPKHLDAGVVDFTTSAAKDLVRRFWRPGNPGDAYHIECKALGLVSVLKHVDHPKPLTDINAVLIGGLPFKPQTLKQLLYEGELMLSLGKRLLDAGYTPVYLDTHHDHLHRQRPLHRYDDLLFYVI